MRIAGWVAAGLMLTGCGWPGLTTQAVVADVGNGPLIVLVGAGQPDSRQWLDAATPGYRFVRVTADHDLDSLSGAGARVMVVPGAQQTLGLKLAQQDADHVVGILLLADGTPLLPDWDRAVAAHGWKWRVIDVRHQPAPARQWWQDWLPPKPAAFTVQP